MKNIKLLALFVIMFSAMQGQTVKHPIGEISTNIMRYKYLYSKSADEKKEIRYIIVKTAADTVKTCFDACDVCYKEDKGFSQKGNILVCNNCGNQFKIESLGVEGKGGCWPGYLAHIIENDSISIKITDLIAGEYYFPVLSANEVKEDNYSKVFNLIQSNNSLVMKFPSAKQRVLRIISMNGQVSGIVSSETNESIMDLSNYSSGIYLIICKENNGIYSKIFTIIR